MSLITALSQNYPQFTFTQGDRFSWAPHQSTIYYRQLRSATDTWSLFHELGHAQLDHQEFQTDISLLIMEVEAWQRAAQLAGDYDVRIEWRHIEHCIDSYRDWLHARSTCPSCRMVTFQISPVRYRCFNCRTEWQVTKSRLCRPHRRQVNQKQLPVNG